MGHFPHNVLPFISGHGDSGLEWVRVYFGLVDITAPILFNTMPSNAQEGIGLSTTIALSLIDPIGIDGRGLNVNSVFLEVAGHPAWQNDVAQPNYSVEKTPIEFGFTYVITPDDILDEFAWIPIHVYAEDLESPPNVLDVTYSFKTLSLALNQRFVVPGAGWIKGLSYSLSDALLTGSLAVVVYVDYSPVLSWPVLPSYAKAYKILSEAERVAVTLGQIVECKVATTADFELISAPAYVAADVIMEYGDLVAAQNP
jgi:hypothetical protein